jgi:hypothetical protein
MYQEQDYLTGNYGLPARARVDAPSTAGMAQKANPPYEAKGVIRSL